MVYEYGRGNRFLVQDIEAYSDEVGAIALGKESDRTNKPGMGLTKLGAPLKGCVLAHDCAGVGAPGFFEGAQGADGAHVINATHDDTARAGLANVPANDFKAVISSATTA